MAGQAVEFRTSDPTMHNINVQPASAGDAPFDTSQAPDGDAAQHTFSQPETMIPVRCNNHPWMQAFINVAPNPFFAVSDGQGHFAIHGLPPGTYTLVCGAGKAGSRTAVSRGGVAADCEGGFQFRCQVKSAAAPRPRTERPHKGATVGNTGGTGAPSWPMDLRRNVLES